MGDQRFESYFRLNKILLKITGILPFESFPTQVKPAVVVFSVSAAIYLIVPMASALFYRWDEIDKEIRSDVITMLEATVFVFLKVMWIIPNRESFSKLVKNCGYLWKSVESDEESRAMAAFAKLGRSITRGYMYAIVGDVIWISTMPGVVEFLSHRNGTDVTANRVLPYPTGWDVPRDNTDYYTRYTLQVLAGSLSCILVGAIDTAIAVLTLHGTAHMKLVQFWLNEITKCQSTREERTSASMTSEERMKMFKCIKHHRNVLNYCQELEDFANLICLMQTVLSTTMIAITGLTMLTEGSDKIKCVLSLVALLIQLLIYYWPAQYLSTESFEVSQSVYSTPWTSWSLTDQKLMLIVMIRAQKAVPLTSGKFTVMSLAALSELISKTMSFFTVLMSTM